MAMCKVIIFLISILFTMNLYPQNRQADREPVAAGRFYPADKETLSSDLSKLFSGSGSNSSAARVRAIISPHAGYVFSGKIAADAYASIPKESKYKNIFIIGSSHVMAFNGASVFNTGDYMTPLGRMKVNLEIAEMLKANNSCFRFPVTSHSQEHSLEVQIPFIQYYFKSPPPIVPIIIGTDSKSTIMEIAAALKPYFNSENLFIISSDFSHYPSYTEANIVDKATADAIVTGSAEIFLNELRKNSSKNIEGLATSMCGWTSGLTLLYLTAQNPDLEYRKIAYCNSGDSRFGNKDEVVGYNAIIVTEKNRAPVTSVDSESDVSFSPGEKDMLFSIARGSITKMLNENKRQIINPATVPPALCKKMGAFVTLKIKGELRGCIGRFTSNDPLYEVVNQMAEASAFDDGRFTPLTRAEFEKTDIEISVLGPLKKIRDTSEIVLGKHGIYIKKDFRTGTMLPQVAIEQKWTLEQFLGYTSRDKAGLGWLGWKDAEIYIYEAVVLEEKKK
jgi:AmmeMemoRadiSam system protein B/AmmeMemoRadiSam system protein A